MNAIVKVRPRQIAEYEALHWSGYEDFPALQEMAEKYGWVVRVTSVDPGDRFVSIKGRGPGSFRRLRNGCWVVALNTRTGAVGVLSGRRFREMYEETPEA